MPRPVESAVLGGPARSNLLRTPSSGSYAADSAPSIVRPNGGTVPECRLDPPGPSESADSGPLLCPGRVKLRSRHNPARPSRLAGRRPASHPSSAACAHAWHQPSLRAAFCLPPARAHAPANATKSSTNLRSKRGQGVLGTPARGVQGGSGAPTCTSSRIDRPCRGTYRGGTPRDQRSQRQHDPAVDHRFLAFPRCPRASVQHLPTDLIPTPTARRAAAPIIHRLPSTSTLTAGSAPPHESTSPRPSTAHVGHLREPEQGREVRACTSWWCWCWCWCFAAGAERPPVQVAG